MSKYLEDRVSELELMWRQPSPWATDSDLNNLKDRVNSLAERININNSNDLRMLERIEKLEAIQTQPCTDKPSDKEETILCGRCYKRLCTYTYTSVVAHKDWMPVCMECFDKLVAR